KTPKDLTASCHYRGKIMKCPTTNGTSCLHNHHKRCRKYPYSIADKKIVTFLKYFFDAIVCTSGSLYDIANSYFNKVYGVYLKLIDSIYSEDLSRSLMASRMKGKHDM
ncbi:hypothetical protein CFOL_v3_19236, partial [Cephalotus follicularis]